MMNNQTEYSELEVSNNNTKQNTSLKLNSIWNFWYASRKEQDRDIPYSDRLQNIAEFSTLEDFFKYYLYIKAVPDIERNTDLGLFKQGYQPLWESCPDSGCWFIRFKKTDDPVEIDNKWEKLVFALVGN
jgi:translation initiation factor 4E